MATSRQLAQWAANAGFRGNDLVIAVAVAYPESGGNPLAIGDSGRSFGIWQIHKPAHPELFTGKYNWRSGQDNALMAKIVHGKQGWNAWTGYTSGAYRAHMGKATAAAKRVKPGMVIQPAGVGPLPNPFGLPGDIADLWKGLGSADDALRGIAAAFLFIADPHNWLRVATFVAGAALVGYALYKITPFDEQVDKVIGAGGQAAKAVATKKVVA